MGSSDIEGAVQFSAGHRVKAGQIATLHVYVRVCGDRIRIDEEPPCPVQTGIWLSLSRGAKIVHDCWIAYYTNTACMRLLRPPDHTIRAVVRDYAFRFG